jgi:hypothetical protein
MRRYWHALLGLMILSNVLQSDFAVAEEVKPLYTNKSRFRIPYRFDPQELARAGATEIQLFISTDLGQNWKPIQSVGMQQGKFEFTAPQDGEYWFAVRAVDRIGNLQPPGAIQQPGLIVVVDSLPPTIQLDLQSTGAGRIELLWSIADSHLDLKSLVLEYREDQDIEWKRVHLVPAANGKTSWSTLASKTEVRGKILDLAENASTDQRTVNLSLQPASTPTIPAPLRQRVQPPSSGGSGGGNREQPYVPDFSQPIAGEHQPSLSMGTGPELMDNSGSDKDLAQVIRSQDSTSPKNAHGNLGNGSMPLVTNDRYNLSPNAPTVNPANKNHTPSTVRTSAVNDSQSRLRIVNTDQFQLDYQIEDVGPSGVSVVEIFITEDQGKHWWKYGDDTDMRSPANIKVPKDGDYGFEIRVKNGVGICAPPPHPGDPVSITVRIDRTAPVAELVSIKQGAGGDLNQLIFTWKARDQNLSEKPVSLYCSPKAEGPWEPIMGWQSDTGSYEWTFGREAPAQMFFRLAVRDAAGNISTVSTPNAVALDLKQPSVRILDVAPLNQNETYR